MIYSVGRPKSSPNLFSTKVNSLAITGAKVVIFLVIRTNKDCCSCHLLITSSGFQDELLVASSYRLVTILVNSTIAR